MKYSGLAPEKAVGAVFSADKKNYYLTKKTKKVNSPASYKIKVGVSHSFKQAIKIANEKFICDAYRPDLQKEVLGRICAMKLVITSE